MTEKKQKKKEHPYNPYTRAHTDQRILRICPNCGYEHEFYREAKHQHWNPTGTQTGELVETDGTVYIKCDCGNRIKTRLKPMSASMPRSVAVEQGLLEPEKKE